MRLFSRCLYASAALLLGATICLSAQEAAPPASAPQSAPMLERFGKPYVMVTINGKGPYRFVIDTGTGAEAFVTPQLADELRLPSFAEALVSDPSHQGSERVPIVLLRSLGLAGVEFSDVKAIVHTVTGEAGSCQGMLGFTLFRSYLLTLDFPNRQVSLASGALTEDDDKTVLPFRMPDGVPITQLRVDGQSVDAQLDSGGSGLTLPEALAAHLKWEQPPVVFANGQTMTTRFAIKAARLRGNVKVARYAFDTPVVEIHPAFPLVNFGSPPMQSFAITFDQKSLLVRLWAKGTRFQLQVPPSPMQLTDQKSPLPPPDLVPIG